ncbi:hypothetical protein E4K10_47135 [Streptomyces sp. T1317-0309]|nr:hypothetical protein E4K10_47135 [Streptomyces sp. T1317-0309]
MYEGADKAISDSFDKLIRSQITEIGGTAFIDSYAKEIEKLFSKETLTQPSNLRGPYAQWNAAYYNIFEDYAWKSNAYEEAFERTIVPLWRQKDVANPAYPAYAKLRPYLRTPHAASISLTSAPTCEAFCGTRSSPTLPPSSPNLVLRRRNSANDILAHARAPSPGGVGARAASHRGHALRLTPGHLLALRSVPGERKARYVAFLI